MQKFNWDSEKNVKLISDPERSISFEQIIEAIDKGGLFSDREHYNDKHPHQRVMFVEVNNYPYMVPYVTEENSAIFLKTIIPSRKATKEYLGNS